MQIFRPVLFLAAFLLLITFLMFVGEAEAGGRPGFFARWIGGNAAYNSQPHLNDAHTPNDAQWGLDDWTPARWGIVAGADYQAVLDGFYKNDVITDQYVRKEIAYLEVGDAFIRLSDQDKGRVVASVDMIAGTLSKAGSEVIYIVHDRTNEIIGNYTKLGLQLQ